MHLKKLKKLILFTLAGGIFVSCSQTVDSMTEDYNSVFTLTNSSQASQSENPKNPSIHDADFNQANMLTGPYTVRTYSTLCLIAPSDAERYEWTVLPLQGNGLSKDSASVTICKNQQLNLYLSESSLPVWTEYALTLTAYAGDGSKYTDTATLWIVPE